MRKKDATGNSKIREEHKLDVLNHIRKHGPASRTNIYKKTNISKPTVTRVIEELLKQGMIRETGVGESAVGRKPVFIELDRDACYCIGINISRNSIYASMVDFGMNVISKRVASIKEIKDVTVFEDTIVKVAGDLIDGSGVDRHKILGIGIGVPGIVDYERGIIMDFAIVHNMMDIHLKEYLEQNLGLKVYIDNNANTRALGEYWYGYGTGHNDIIYVICSEGVGSGIIVDGRVLRGKCNVTSGLGHMTVNIGGRRCACGRYGCVEAYCSTTAVEDIAKEALRRGRSSVIPEKENIDIEAIDYRFVCKYADEGDRLCLEQLEDAACVFATGLSNMIGVFNPEIVILSGDLFDASEYFYKKVIEITRQKLFSSFAGDVIFVKREVKDSLYEIGAAAMVLKAFYKD